VTVPALMTAVVDRVDVAAAIAAPDWLCTLWFVLMCVLLAGYAILDGFDLGVGIIHFIVGRTDADRTAHVSVIGPIWDGNEVWLVTFGGALFAGFPLAYASIFSAFMVPLVLVLFCLILRAVSLEFRAKFGRPISRLVCDLAFSGSSLLASLLFGVAVGAAMEGIPIDAAGALVLPAPDGGTPGPLAEITFALTPFSLATGVLAVTLFAVHGALFLNLRTDGRLRQRIGGVFMSLYIAFALAFIGTTILAFESAPVAVEQVGGRWWGMLVAILNVLAILNLPRSIHHGRPVSAFVSSCCVVLALVFLFGAGIFPNLVKSTLDPGWDVTIFDAASSRGTMLTMLVVVSFGMPFVLLYTAITYWTFRGRVGGEGEDDGDRDTLAVVERRA